MYDFSGLFIQFLTGLTQAMFIFLVASGLSLIFGTLGVINFAHGSLYMLGAYFCLTILKFLFRAPTYFWLAMIFAPFGVAVTGAFIEIVLIRKIYKHGLLEQIIVTYGLILIFGDLIRAFWGTQDYSMEKPLSLEGSINILGQPFPVYYFLVLIITPCIAVLLWYFLTRTKWGWIVNATTSDREMMSALGMNVPRLFTLVFICGSWLGGLGGALMAPVVAINPGMDMEVLIESFIVIVIGGLGSISGAFIGSLILGQINAFGILLLPQYALIFAYVLMAVILIVKPWGLKGKLTD